MFARIGNPIGKPIRPASLMRASLALVVACLCAVMPPPAQAGEACAPALARQIEVGAQTFHIDIAANMRERERGLSGRESLAAEKGMWFVFPSPGKHGFWMRDMSFPIDLIWVSPGRKVLGSMTLQPCTAMPCPIHLPPGPVSYVLEVNAGEFTGKAGDPVRWTCEPQPRK